ncbi:MAG: hypothetical protein ACRBBJ_07140 [Rhodomicrobiaceae bacterium]
MDRTILSKNKSNNKFINLIYEEQQAAAPPAHLQASVVGIRQPKTPQKLSKSIERISEGRDALASR